MAVVPMIRGNADDDPELPRGRIGNMRKLLVTATAIMAVGLLGSVTVARGLWLTLNGDKGPVLRGAIPLND